MQYLSRFQETYSRLDIMFAVLVPATVLPLVLTLFWAERKAKRLGIVDDEVFTDSTKHESRTDRLKRVVEHLDLLGLLLLGAAVSLILLPLTISQNVSGGWRNGS